ncbi:MAG TPA: hypothetical protein VHY19_12270 [Steroidobacteraceae bacterium]|jgi:hypothetical protein|nr:hypothetical protein [Steroidobacteraceae bacterium]
MKHTAAIWTAAWLLSGMALLPDTALAQDWKQYSYPTPGFAIQFPVPPSVQSATYSGPGGASLPMTSYLARQAGIVYRLDVVDFSGTHADAMRTIAETEKAMGATGKVTVAVDARVGRDFGRELSVTGTDASRSTVAIFYVGDHLYILDGHSSPPNAIARSGNAVRFQESLQFIGQGGGRGGFGGFGRFGGGQGRFGPGAGPQALSACQGKSAGDSVQLPTPRGPVAATCTLIARPNGPPRGGPPPEAPQPPATTSP